MFRIALFAPHAGRQGIGLHTLSSVARTFAFSGVLVASLFAPDAQAQDITTIAGNGTFGSTGDGGPATSAALWGYGIAVDTSGNRYVADPAHFRIRKITPEGIISTVAGNGSIVDSGDGGPALAAGIGEVFRVAVDAAGNLYLPSNRGSRIRKVSQAGIISTVVGTGVAGFSGDGGAATSAKIYDPFAVVVDQSGNLLFTERLGSRVRKVTPAGIISTVAGNGSFGFSGDGGPAINASFNEIVGIDTDAYGNVFIADASNNRIRKINSSGVISTIAGSGVAGFSGNGGSATAASFSRPYDVRVDSSGNVYVADTNNNQIRKVDSSGTIGAFAGTGVAGFSGDGGPALTANLNLPVGLELHEGMLLIADLFNYRIRQVAFRTAVTCASEGYTGTKLSWCQNICENGYTGNTLNMWLRRWIERYRTLPSCATP